MKRLGWGPVKGLGSILGFCEGVAGVLSRGWGSVKGFWDPVKSLDWVPFKGLGSCEEVGLGSCQGVGVL